MMKFAGHMLVGASKSHRVTVSVKFVNLDYVSLS